MINGAHVVIYSKNAAADRAFFRDILGFTSVDAGHGWLIFGLPPAEVAVHPADENGRHDLFLLCDDLKAEMAALEAKGVGCLEVAEERWAHLREFNYRAAANLVFTNQSIPGRKVPLGSTSNVQPALHVGSELVKEVYGSVNKDGIRPRYKNSGAGVIFVWPPHSRNGSRSIITEEFAVRWHHGPIIVVPPNRVKECITRSRRIVGVPRAKKPRILVINRLDRIHDTALHKILADVRCITFRKCAPTLAPLTGPVASLVERRADTGENEVIEIK